MLLIKLIAKADLQVALRISEIGTATHHVIGVLTHRVEQLAPQGHSLLRRDKLVLAKETSRAFVVVSDRW